MRVLIGLLIAMFGAVVQSSTPGEADEILAQLSKIRLDKKQIYNVRDITLRRDALTIALNRGVIAFVEPVNGKITGAVFIGGGEIVSIPPDSIEKQQVYKHTGTPILNESFQTALLRFTDTTYEEIKREIAQHAEEDVTADDIAQFDSWDSSIARRASGLNLRLLADFLEPATKPFFLVELNSEKRGLFNAVFDMRATEEVSIFQLREVGGIAVPDIWASFNQRSEARNPQSVAHENKSPIDVLSYEIEGTNVGGTNIEAKVAMRMKARTDGARVLDFALSPTLRVASVLTEAGEPVWHRQSPDASELTIVLAQPLKLGQELILSAMYSGDMSGRGPAYPFQPQQTIPSFKSTLPPADERVLMFVDYLGHRFIGASYHDQWLIEGLRRYLPVMSAEAELRKLLADTRDELQPLESAGPISIGQRAVSTLTPGAYRAILDKGVWVIHMIRGILRQAGPNPDAKFSAMLQELAETYENKAVSTWDFQRLVEKHAGRKLDWFFDQWVFDTGLPAYSVEFKVEGSGTEFTIDGTLTQTGVPDGFVMPIPIYADDALLGIVQAGESDGRFRFRHMKKPERIVIDPEMTVLTGGRQ
jgi:hypothetical protein